MRGACSVRVASLADLTILVGIAGACAEAPRWSEGVWRDLLAGEGKIARAAFVAEIAGKIAGFVVVSYAAGMGEIESVAVLPGFRRMGVGLGLCLEAMRWARGWGAEAMELEVRALSVGAIALYEALGFMEQGRRRGYYRDPADDAVLMSVRLLGAGEVVS